MFFKVLFSPFKQFSAEYGQAKRLFFFFPSLEEEGQVVFLEPLRQTLASINLMFNEFNKERFSELLCKTFLKLSFSFCGYSIAGQYISTFFLKHVWTFI